MPWNPVLALVELLVEVKAFKPMLASPANLETLRFPVLASPKLGGIRCLIVDGEPVSLTLKPIPNEFIRSKLKGLPPLDGEIMTISGGIVDDFNTVRGNVMRKEGTPPFVFYAFDWIDPTQPFLGRFKKLQEWWLKDESDFVSVLPHQMVPSVEKLATLHHRYMWEKYEATMIRDPQGLYKQGRSTAKEQGLLKLKP